MAQYNPFMGRCVAGEVEPNFEVGGSGPIRRSKPAD